MKSEQMNFRISGWTRMDIEELAKRYNVSKTDVVEIALVSLKLVVGGKLNPDYPLGTYKEYVESLFHLA